MHFQVLTFVVTLPANPNLVLCTAVAGTFLETTRVVLVVVVAGVPAVGNRLSNSFSAFTGG